MGQRSQIYVETGFQQDSLNGAQSQTKQLKQTCYNQINKAFKVIQYRQFPAIITVRLNVKVSLTLFRIH